MVCVILVLMLRKVYGMSEATGVTHANTDREWRLGSVGKALPGVETRIAEDGEIHIRCGWVFEGYYKDAAKTDEALVDGWYASQRIRGICFLDLRNNLEAATEIVLCPF